jgi:hypothetical protein
MRCMGRVECWGGDWLEGVGLCSLGSRELGWEGMVAGGEKGGGGGDQ